MIRESGQEVKRGCKILEVSRSGYYKKKKEKKREEEIERIIKEIFRKSKETYGRRRIKKELEEEYNKKVRYKTISRIMKENMLVATANRKYRVIKEKASNFAYNNELNREFNVREKNKFWVTDITYISTKNGRIYLSVVIDLYSRKVVGWKVSDEMTTGLVISSIEEALIERGYPKGLVIHSDQGSQYKSKEYREFLEKNEIKGSMSKKGNCWDNACVESFFHSLKVELFYYKKVKSKEEVARLLLWYIEIFYNRERYHSTIGYKNPTEFEKIVPTPAGVVQMRQINNKINYINAVQSV